MKTTRVLIVEDDAIVAMHLERVVRQLGYDVVDMVASGDDAIYQAEQLHPDIILMDIGLGEGIDGWETTRRIKANPLTAHLPIIALTASAFESDRRKSLDAGCCDFDTKPVDLKRLLSKIEQWTQASNAVRSVG